MTRSRNTRTWFRRTADEGGLEDLNLLLGPLHAAPGEVEKPHGGIGQWSVHLREVPIVGDLEEEVVELAVEAHVGLWAFGALRPLDEVLQGLQMAVLDSRDGELRHDRLDPRPHVEDLLEIAERDLTHEGPATRDNLDQPFVSQGMERIPQGGSPHSEPLHQVTFHQCHTGFQLCPQDEVPELSVRGGRVGVGDRTFLSIQSPPLPIRGEYL